VSYQEFPYIIKRRRAPVAGNDQIPNEERLRISEALHTVQESLSNYRAQIRTECTTVSERYDDFVTRTREIAGSQMREAWKGPPFDNDAGMNLHVDYSELDGPERDYLDAAKRDVAGWKIS
jgi:hypothetical protein